MFRISSCLFCSLAILAAITAAQATQAIANWDVVPYQRISEPFKAGVVAFHESGVNVQFHINGEATALIEEPTLNPRTNVWEYWIEIDPAKYPDGPLRVSATAIPDDHGHEARDLETITLYANSQGSLNYSEPVWADAAKGSDETGNGSEASPFASIKKAVESTQSGGTVYLKAGDYKLQGMWGFNGDYWTTISAAPGLSREDVTVLTAGKVPESSTARYAANKIRWQNLSLYCDRNPGPGYIFYINNGQHVWFDGVDISDKQGRCAGTDFANPHGGKIVYLTDSIVRDVANVQINFQRNCEYLHILGDVFRGASNLTAINIKIVDINREDSQAHPDFIQFYNPNQAIENVIIYNVSAYDMSSQGFFGGGNTSDVAFVNILIEKDPVDKPYFSQVGGMTHVLFWNITMVDQIFNFRGADSMDQIYVKNGAYTALASKVPEKEGFFIDACHSSQKVFSMRKLLGVHATTGEMIFADVEKDDYRQAPDSPAYGNGILPPGVPADMDGIPYDTTAPNRGAFAKKNPGGRKAVALY
ncbi:hypothetical protein [Cerasicoccus fimbriatus]|uniref:hypothetical protein n=1 Tax=Cerasicoccus fimbriatus TaxID=3014554 RepID=UPI0022B2BF6E|nr:hypothetical protein [Cerasicoccus sp. TK19100]